MPEGLSIDPTKLNVESGAGKKSLYDKVPEGDERARIMAALRAEADQQTQPNSFLKRRMKKLIQMGPDQRTLEQNMALQAIKDIFAQAYASEDDERSHRNVVGSNNPYTRGAKTWRTRRMYGDKKPTIH